MNEQALEDLLALIKLRNVSRAARTRNISQSAYSRRLQAIEANHGTNLVDRTGRPATPTQILLDMTSEIESALTSIKRVSRNLKRGYRENEVLAIAALHSLSSVPIPKAISQIQGLLSGHQIQLRSGNQSTCFRRLMTEEVSLMLAYETPVNALDIPSDLVIKTRVTTDLLVPAGSPKLLKSWSNITPGSDQIPIVTYPENIFLGQHVHQELIAKSAHNFSQKLCAEMTSAIVSSAQSGLGMAWLPLSSIEGELKHGLLKVIDSPYFPIHELTVSMLQLRTRKMEKLASVCNALSVELENTIQGAYKVLERSKVKL
ncbi:MAG: DNA-binding transcriptional LysR family regulator [Gammaproteobacteria bacterium]|jgi:DNA-binding transcriptional LysR family regulator